ncbi:hypothetical protein [Aliamphritea spongicola]|nr:hypothetical protein [Aliamphritea spongicola]
MKEAVVLLHGLARTPAAFNLLARFLEEAGYQVVNQGYPSTSEPVEALAEPAISTALEACKGASRVHFVTHSMGGILLRYFCVSKPLPDLAGWSCSGRQTVAVKWLISWAGYRRSVG